MCWSNTIAIPLVLKKPLRVYKVGTLTILGNFISLYQEFRYCENKTIPTVKINPEFIGTYPPDAIRAYIYEGYHSYLTKKRARCNCDKHNSIGVFEIPAGATIYVNYEYGEVVSTDIKYLGGLSILSNK